MARTTVFAVTEGIYSDFSICALFESRAAADEAKALGLGDDVREYVLFTGSTKPKKMIVYHANWHYQSGSPDRDVTVHSDVVWNIESLLAGKRPHVTETPDDAPIKHRGGHWIHATGTDADACMKAVADRKAKFLAKLADI